MATAKPNTNTRKARYPWGRRLLFASALLAVAALAWFWNALSARAAADAAYGARIGCACRYVAGRSLDDCRKDLRPGMGLVMLGEDEAEKTVTATFPLLASETAMWRKGPGCTLEGWDD